VTWFIGASEVVSYSDDALGGVEGNVLLDLETQVGPGTMQLSWDFPLANELRVQGSEGEAVLRLDLFDKLAVRKGGAGFQEVPGLGSTHIASMTVAASFADAGANRAKCNGKSLGARERSNTYGDMSPQGPVFACRY
jgi:hypothetical protein